MLANALVETSQLDPKSRTTTRGYGVEDDLEVVLGTYISLQHEVDVDELI